VTVFLWLTNLLSFVILITRKQRNMDNPFARAYTIGGNKMRQNAMRSGNMLERKIISVSMKRQLTIPQKYFESLGFDNEAECILQDDGLLIRPLRDTSVGEFSEQILADLISQGYQGQELLEKFKLYSKAVRPAVLKMIEESEKYTSNGKGRIPMEELFGAEE
jgi:hypothetical protein